MIIIDSCGWLEHFLAGPLAAAYAPYLEQPDQLVPTIVMYEVYKTIRRQVSVVQADLATIRLTTHQVIPLDEAVALAAAEESLEHGLSLADAVVYATARMHSATVVTSDEHFAQLEHVNYIPKEAEG